MEGVGCGPVIEDLQRTRNFLSRLRLPHACDGGKAYYIRAFDRATLRVCPEGVVYGRWGDVRLGFIQLDIDVSHYQMLNQYIQSFCRGLSSGRRGELLDHT